MYARWLNVLVCLFLFSMVVSCAGADGISGGARFQSFDFGNDGVGNITGGRIQYGRIKLPTGRDFDNPPLHRTTFSETITIPVPETALITWRSQDGHSYAVDAPIRSLIRDPGIFYGFKFYFVDDHVDIYLTERINNPGPYLDVKYTKIYSSK